MRRALSVHRILTSGPQYHILTLAEAQFITCRPQNAAEELLQLLRKMYSRDSELAVDCWSSSRCLSAVCLPA